MSDKEKNSEKHITNKKMWHTQQEAILKRWSEIGSSYRYMHGRAYDLYNSKNLYFALPVIIISTVTGTANFAQKTFPEDWQIYVPLVIGFLNLTAGLLTTVAQFLRVSELLEGHRAAAIAYSKFSRNISVEISLPREDRTCGGSEYVTACRTELDKLIEQSPNIPHGIVRHFSKKFVKRNFMKPEILNISEVDIYRDNKEEKARQEIVALEHLEATRQRVLSIENERRQSIMEELTFNRKIKEETFQKELELRKIKKKKNVNISSVANSMEKLINKLNDLEKDNDIVTPNSSDMSSEDGDETITGFNDHETVENITLSIADIIDPSNNHLDVV